MTVVEFRVRMPPALHEQLKARAAQQGVSLNQLCVTLLASGVGFKFDLEARIGQITNAELEAQIAEVERRRHAR